MVDNNLSKLMKENLMQENNGQAFPEGEGLLVNNSLLGGINKKDRSMD